MKRKITAIMAADVAEYTRLISEDEEETLARLESYRLVFDDFVKRAGGRIFNTAGDGVMCEFPSAVEATRCAIDIQESLRTRNLAYPATRQMHFRIGISIGDVVERDGDLLGDGVNIAARLQSLAEPGSICVSRNVHEAVTNKISVPFRDLGSREVKNLPHPVHAFQIEMGPRDRMSAIAAARSAPKGDKAGLPVGAFVAGAAALAIGVAAGAFLMGRDRPAPPQPGPLVAQPAPVPVPAAPSPPAEPAKPPQQASVVVTENLTPAEAFDRLAKSGGIVRDPKSAPELYHNARSFEARGEAAAARRDYLAFAALGTDHLDPLMRLASLIRTQDGRAGAREVFAELSKGKGRAAALVHILQFEGIERQTRLGAFAESNPDYAPVHALIAQEFGEDRQNGQTIDDRRRELAATERFLLAEREGKLVPFFLDQSVLAQWI
ncbi:MAG: adenylate/guanylate cyclase domain-containing protein, partial [Rhabdaerophilum sp.]